MVFITQMNQDMNGIDTRERGWINESKLDQLVAQKIAFLEYNEKYHSLKNYKDYHNCLQFWLGHSKLSK